LRHLAAACGPQQRSVPRQSRIALPVAVPSGAGRQVEGRLAAHGEQSPGQVLPPHCLRPAAARTASGAVESGLVRRRQRVGGGMTFLHRLASVVRWLFHRNSAEQDLNDELQAFVDMAAADKVRDGAPPTEARRLAVLDLGWQVVLNGTSFADRPKRVSGGRMALLHRLAAIVRWLVHRNRVEQDLNDEIRYIRFPKHYSTAVEWREWRRLNSVFTDIAATEPRQPTLSGDGDPEQVPGRRVTSNFWTVLGARPLVGRVFTKTKTREAS